MSEVKSLHQKLVNVMKQVGVLDKDGINSFHKYKYTTVSSLQKKVQKALVENDLHLETFMDVVWRAESEAVVKVVLTISDGVDKIVLQGLGEGADKGDKSIPKAISNAVKYAWATGLCVAWVELDDPEEDKATDEAASSYAKYLGLIQSVSTKKALEALIPELEGLTTKKAITPGQASKLRKAYSAQAVKLS